MAKLLIYIEHEFEAGPMLAAKKSGGGTQTLPLSAKELKVLLDESDLNDFSLSISILDPEEGWPCFGFEMTRKGLKKGGIFEWVIDWDAGRAKVKVKGEIASSPLRAGMVTFIKTMGENADFRLQAFNFKGGEFGGFTAPIHGQGEDDFKNWFQIKTWSVK